jgi:glutathione S-transferase
MHTDSTPIIYDLEKRHAGDRSLLPEDAASAFIAHLLEDMADEWGTKLMFHYRWFRDRDQEACSRWLAFDSLRSSGGAAMIESAAAMFKERQVGRMEMVGCTAANAPLIDESLKRLLAIFEDFVPRQDYLFGSRPSLADFGWYAQLFQLASDPTAGDLMRETAPLSYRWVQLLDDCSGVEGDWQDNQQQLPAAVEGLLEMAGTLYLPFLLANAEALEQGEKTFHFSAFGHDYRQGTFKYQKKCLAWLREELAGLNGAAREKAQAWLEKADCWEGLDAGKGGS